jgi:hypothetical protein
MDWQIISPKLERECFSSVAGLANWESQRAVWITSARSIDASRVVAGFRRVGRFHICQKSCLSSDS